MALVKLGFGFDELKGKVGGVIFSGFRGATVVRNRKACGGLDSQRWDNIRNALVNTSSQWSELTTPEQTAWQAATPSFPYEDKFGDQQEYSGYELFVKLNFFLVQAGNPIMTTPPAPVVKPNYGPIAMQIPDAANFSLSWAGITSPSFVINIRMAPVMSKGVTRVPTRLRSVTTVLSTVGQPVNLAPLYLAAWGSIPPSGRFYVTTKAVSLVSFEQFSPLSTFADL